MKESKFRKVKSWDNEYDCSDTYRNSNGNIAVVIQYYFCKAIVVSVYKDGIHRNTRVFKDTDEYLNYSDRFFYHRVN